MVCIARDVVCFCSLHHLDTCTDEEEMKKLNSEQHDRVDLKMGHSKDEAGEETTRKCLSGLATGRSLQPWPNER